MRSDNLAKDRLDFLVGHLLEERDRDQLLVGNHDNPHVVLVPGDSAADDEKVLVEAD